MSEIPCPACGAFESRVTDGRPNAKGHFRRRRKCGGCGVKFSTYEISAAEYSNIDPFKVAILVLEEVVKGVQVEINDMRRTNKYD